MLKALLEKRNKLAVDMKAIYDKCKTEKRDMTVEESASVDAMLADADKLEPQIERAKKVANLNERSAAPINAPVTESGTVTPGNEQRAAWVSFLRTGDTRAMTVGTAADGGYLAPKDFATDLAKIVVEKSPMRQLARVMTISGRSVLVPVMSAGPSASWVAEGSAPGAESKATYGQVEIPLHMARTYTDVSIEAVNDSAFNLEEQITEDLGNAFSAHEGTGFISGNGTGKPSGILDVTDNGITPIASGSATAFDGDDLIDLLYSLKEAYQRNATWLFNRATLKFIRKLKVNSEYIWSPGGLGNVNNVTQGLAPTLLDRPYQVAPDMESIADGKIPVAVGDFKAGYRVAINPNAGLVILRDPYTVAKEGLVRFVGLYRVGGAVVMPEAIALLKTSVS